MGLIAHGTHRARCPRGATGRPVRPIPRAPAPHCPGLHDKPARRPRPVPSCERGRPPSGPRDGLRYTRGCVGAASGAGLRIRREPSSRRGPPAAHTWKGRGRCGGRGPDAAAEPRAAPLGRVPCAGGRGRGLSASHGAGGVDAHAYRYPGCAWRHSSSRLRLVVMSRCHQLASTNLLGRCVRTSFPASQPWPSPRQSLSTVSQVRILGTDSLFPSIEILTSGALRIHCDGEQRVTPLWGLNHNSTTRVKRWDVYPS